MSSSGRSATSASRLFRSIRSGASVCQERALRAVPRGARIRERSPQSSSTTASREATLTGQPLVCERGGGRGGSGGGPPPRQGGGQEKRGGGGGKGVSPPGGG